MRSSKKLNESTVQVNKGNTEEGLFCGVFRDSARFITNCIKKVLKCITKKSLFLKRGEQKVAKYLYSYNKNCH
jgi:hypothetical protein